MITHKLHHFSLLRAHIIVWLVALAVFMLLHSAPAQAGPEAGDASESISPVEPKPPPPYPPTSHYQVKTVEGWSVLVNRDFLQANPELAERTLNLLQRQLEQVARRVPAQSLKTLRTIRIWVEEREPNTPCMAYHPNADWLREHGVNPDKARCVELANAKNFLAWTVDQPWMVLHELAHGFHHQHLDQGFQNRPLQAQFDRARAEGLYDSVLRINGKREKGDFSPISTEPPTACKPFCS